MKIQEDIHNKCTIFGSLSLVLRISRVFGVAPIKFERAAGGWRIRVSRVYRLYGLVITTMFGFLSLLALLGNLQTNIHILKTSLTKRFITRRVIWLVDIFVMSMVITTAAWTGVGRMRYLIDSNVQLQQMNQNLQRYHKPSHLNERKKWWIVVIVLILVCFTVITCYMLSMAHVIYDNNEVLLSSFDIFYGISNVTILLVVMQLALMVMGLHQTLQLLNTSLHNLHQELYEQKSTSSSTPVYPGLIRRDRRTRLFNTVSHKSIVDVIPIAEPLAMNENKYLETAPAILHRLADYYCSMCDLIRQLNESSGLVLLLLYLSFFLHLIMAPYRVVVDIFLSEQKDLQKIWSQIIWTILHFTKLMIISESCHRTHEQMAITKNLINRMLRYTTSDDFAVKSELKLFSRHIMLNDVTISLNQFFTVNRTLVASILGSITTYLVIAVQFL